MSAEAREAADRLRQEAMYPGSGAYEWTDEGRERLFADILLVVPDESMSHSPDCDQLIRALQGELENLLAVIQGECPSVLPDHGAMSAEAAIEAAEKYLAEHPADDDEPVTVEWLESVGFRKTSSTDEALGGPSHHINYVTKWVAFGPGISEWYVTEYGNSVFLPTPKTRRDVRRLCKALGIELKQ